MHRFLNLEIVRSENFTGRANKLISPSDLTIPRSTVETQNVDSNADSGNNPTASLQDIQEVLYKFNKLETQHRP